MPCYSSEWPHNQHRSMYDRASSITSNNCSVREDYVLSSANKSSLMSNYLNDLRVSKKKSRGSKRQSPVTILNADASNFRALVQQLTGRPRQPTRLRPMRGPLNINFSKAKEVDPRLVFKFGHNSMHHQPVLHVAHDQQGFCERRKDEGVMLSSGEQSNHTSFPMYSDHTINSKEFDDFDLDIDQCLEELASMGGFDYDQS